MADSPHILASMLLPGLAHCSRDSTDPVSGSSFSHRDATYYFPDELIEGDGPLRMLRGTMYQFLTYDHARHLRRAWRIAGYNSLRIQGTVSLPIGIFTVGPATAGTWSFDFTLSSAHSAPGPWTKWAAIVGGTPDRGYAHNSGDLVHPLAESEALGTPDAINVPGINTAGNVQTPASRAGWELPWMLPVDASGTAQVHMMDAEIPCYRFPAYDIDPEDPDPPPPPTGTSIDVSLVFSVSIFATSACPLRNTYGDVPWWPIIIGFWCRAELVAGGHTPGDTYSQLSTWDEDNTSSPYFGAANITNAWSSPSALEPADLPMAGALEIQGEHFPDGGSAPSIDLAVPDDGPSPWPSFAATLSDEIAYP